MKQRLMWLASCSASIILASSFNPGKNVVRTVSVPATPDPVEATGGAFYFSKTLLDIGGPMNMSFAIHYNSGFEQWANDIDPPFWWSHKYSLEDSTVNGTNIYKVGFGKGSEVQFIEIDGEWHLAGPDSLGNVANGSSVRCALHVSTQHVYFINYDTEQVCIFEKKPFHESRILTLYDRQTNSLTYTYPGSTTKTPSRIEDNYGNYLAFHTYGDTITGVVDALDRQVFLRYENAPGNNNFRTLVGVTDAMGHTTRFTYMVVTNAMGHKDFNNIASVIPPSGAYTYSQVYARVTLDGNDIARVIEQRDAYGNTVYFSYDTTNNIITTTWPGGGTTRYNATREYGALESITDEVGRSIDFTHNDRQQMTSMTDRDGDTTQYVYDDTTHALQMVSNAAHRQLWCEYSTRTQTFHNPYTNESIQVVFSDISAVHYQDGTIDRFYYNVGGALVSNINRNGAVKQYTYDTRGMLTSIRNELGGGNYYEWSDNGRLTAQWESDPGIGTNYYSYDAVGRMLTNHFPDGSYRACTYDDNDHVVSIRDARGNVTTYSYDENGNLSTVTDANGNTIVHTYDALNRPVTVTNCLGHAVHFSYNACDRLAAVTDPLGNTTHLHTDMQGGVTNVIDPAGYSFRTIFTVEELQHATLSPSGHQTTYGYDALGYLIAVTNPLGNAWQIHRDAMNRVTSLRDPDGQTLVYQYNDIGLLTSVTNAILGIPRYEYDSLGVLTHIYAVNGGNWRFIRSPQGRLTQMRDPLGYDTRYTYTYGGRLDTITYPDGTVARYYYNADGAVTQKMYSTGLKQNRAYDPLGNLTAVDDIVLKRNADGKITNTLSSSHSYSAAYDAAGRLVRLGYDNDAFGVTYSYDTRGFLTSVSNTRDHIVLTFSHDADGFLETISRPNGVDSSYNWDAAKHLITLYHGTIASQHFSYTSAGRLHQCEYTLPLDPADYVVNSAHALTFDTAYRIESAPYAYDTLGRVTNAPAGTLSWDAASRLTRLGTTVFTYNGFGNITSAIGAGKTNHFFYNYALGSSSPVADDNYYYVYTPAGRLLYLVSKKGAALPRYYHFDRNGSTLFLTDESGNVTDAYAYSPYGELLARTGTTHHPFTYYGQSGVMRVADTDTYAMRVRWYDARAARFVSREPAWPQLDDPYMLNPYQYAANNPITYGDASGLRYKDEIAQAERDLALAKAAYGIFDFFARDVNPWYYVCRAGDWVVNEPIAPVTRDAKNTSTFKDDSLLANKVHNYEETIWLLKQKQREYERAQERERQKRAARREFEKKAPALQQMAMNKARQAVLNMKIANRKSPHPWGKMDSKQDTDWGLWIKADGQWLFFPEPDNLRRDQLLVKPGYDPRGKYHDRANVHVQVEGADIGVWLHNVQEVHQGHGPAW